jgi:hypothetical protein
MLNYYELKRVQDLWMEMLADAQLDFATNNSAKSSSHIYSVYKRYVLQHSFFLFLGYTIGSTFI